MTLQELLIQRRDALCERWLDAILAEYGEITAVRWRREKDRFANPIGHALRTGLPELLEAAAGTDEPSATAVTALEAIIRIRSVQDLPASRAVAFLFKLRDVVRAELGADLGGVAREELSLLDRGVERLTLRAFDIYVRFREQVFRLRTDELKRSVALLLRRWHGEIPEPDSDVVQLSPPPQHGNPR